MAFILTSNSSLQIRNPNIPSIPSSSCHRSLKTSTLRSSFFHSPPKPHLKSSFISFSSFSTGRPSKEDSSSDKISSGEPSAFVDEWGDKTKPETDPTTKFSDADPPKDDDEWGGDNGVGDYAASGNGSTGADSAEEDKVGDLKRCLVDSVYGTDLGFQASAEVRAEVLELVTQLEGLNPTPVPTDALDVLEGNWILLFTAFSELVPLLAAGSTPLLKVDKICQDIDTKNLTIDNSVTLSGPFATFTFSATANFEIRSPSRIQVEFKEGTFKPPAIKSSVDLPEEFKIFGQTINLSAVQQSLNPLQDGVASIARAISGQPPLKVAIPGERQKSWLLITYLDKDLRISRGDGGLFVLAKEGSPLLY